MSDPILLSNTRGGTKRLILDDAGAVLEDLSTLHEPRSIHLDKAELVRFLEAVVGYREEQHAQCRARRVEERCNGISASRTSAAYGAVDA